MKPTILTFLLLGLLTACGGAAPATPTIEAPIVISHPTIEVSGDLTASGQASNFYIASVKGSDGTVKGTMLYLQDNTRIVFIRFPQNATPGTYEINLGFIDENYDGTVATGNYLDSSTGTNQQFAANGGTLTLESTGSSYSGSYTFTAQGDNGQNVTVSGTFTDIPFEAAV